MRSLRRASTIVLVVLLLGALLAPGALAEQPNKEVPLKGDFVGVGGDFSGNFSHLGRFEGVIDVNTFAAVWTAANGDTVTNQTIFFEIDFSDEVAPGVYPYEQTIVITGGTGRFTDAMGSAFIEGLVEVDLATFEIGEYDGHLEGAITQPGPRRDK